MTCKFLWILNYNRVLMLLFQYCSQYLSLPSMAEKKRKEKKKGKEGCKLQAFPLNKNSIVGIYILIASGKCPKVQNFNF